MLEVLLSGFSTYTFKSDLIRVQTHTTPSEYTLEIYMREHLHLVAPSTVFCVFPKTNLKTQSSILTLASHKALVTSFNAVAYKSRYPNHSCVLP